MKAENLKSLVPCEKTVKLLGRTWSQNDKLWLGFSGSGAEFEFEGSYLALQVSDGEKAEQDYGNTRLAVYVDGLRVLDAVIEKPTMLTVVDLQEAKKCVVRIVKLSEAAMSVCCIEKLLADYDAVVKPVSNKKRYIEFVGDSITCGYGIDDEDPLHGFSTKTEDVTKAYAYITAEGLGADYSIVALSGYGIISGYTGTGIQNTKELLSPYYESAAFSYQKADNVAPHTVKWDFQKRQSDLVVVFLGTNDDSYCLDDRQKQDDFCRNYAVFLKKIRKNNPDSQILCILGTMTDRLFPFVEQAVDCYCSENSDSKVYARKMPVMIPDDGLAADYHPTARTQKKAAEKLTAFIEEITGW